MDGTLTRAGAALDALRALERFGRHAGRAGFDAPRGLAPAQHRSLTDLRAIQVTRAVSAELRITTDEGDVVTLHASSSLEAGYARLRHRERGPDGASRLSATRREIQITRETSITVEGELSEQELEDIRRLVARIEPLLAGFSPRQGAALALRLDPSAFESLAGFRLDVERTASFTRVHVRERSWSGAGAGGFAKPAPARMPVSLPPADEAAARIGARPLPEPMPASPARTEA